MLEQPLKFLGRVLRGGRTGVADAAVLRPHERRHRAATSAAWPSRRWSWPPSSWCCSPWGARRFLNSWASASQAFRIFGGMLLFLLSLEMVFARESGTRTSSSEAAESKRRADVSVFPLAFPFIAGPGALATILLWFGPLHVGADAALFAAYLVAVFVVLAIALVLMLLARTADARDRCHRRECRGASAGGDPGRARGAVRARWPAPGVRRRLMLQPARRKARSHTSCPRRSPRRSKRVGSRSGGRGTNAPSAARFSSCAFAAERLEHREARTAASRWRAASGRRARAARRPARRRAAG